MATGTRAAGLTSALRPDPSSVLTIDPETLEDVNRPFPETSRERAGLRVRSWAITRVGI